MIGLFADELRKVDSSSRIEEEVTRRMGYIKLGCKEAAENGKKEYESGDLESHDLGLVYGHYDAELRVEHSGMTYEYSQATGGYGQKKNFSRQEVAIIAEKLKAELEQEGFSTVHVEIRNGWRLERWHKERFFLAFLGDKIREVRKELPDYGIWVRVTW